MDLSKIPNRLRGKPYFCLMKLEQKLGKTKKDKVPYRTNGARADPTNPEHFTSLEKVIKIFDKGGYDGIGIGVFDDVIAIDIDHCVEDGKLNDFATEIVETLKTYAKFSISGTGVHIWARAPGLIYDKERYYFNNRACGISLKQQRQMPEQGYCRSQRMWHRCFRQSSRTGMLPKWKNPLMATVDSCFMMTMECHLWQCTGSTDSTTWSADTMIFIECRCQTSRLMYVDTPIAVIWRNRE